ncbi:pseudouridine synthase [Halodesulfovibrio marinisediminis]|uniref:Pseudouridine synthase n=1 Tax=Halodesulfovibrio marinisediminis DSM 17456 TaxID=1121457 RepID=A0A1N6E6I3_9BACT|nr:pseudouridine synthase [Halodesulfovibrio marinisediminis]SIN78547.1 S4 domain-containing protein [Halodesulfovibrio marinisediminis DSM 17456]
MSEQNKKFSEDRRGRRTGFGDRSERHQSGNNAARHNNDERTPKKRTERSYFDSNGKYQGRPISDGESRRNTYNDLPGRASSGKSYRKDERRGDRDSRENFGSRNRGEKSDSGRRSSRSEYKGRPVDQNERRRNDFDRSERVESRRTDRDFRGGDRQRDSRREDFRSRDNRDRFDSRDRQGRNDSWNRNERGEQTGSDRRPSRGGYQGRPVERNDRQRDSRREDFRSRDNRDRFDSRDRQGRNDSWNRSERDEQTGSARRPSRGGYQGRPGERGEKRRNEERDNFRRSDRDYRGGDRQNNSRRSSSERDDRRNSEKRRFENRDRNDRSGRFSHTKNGGNEPLRKHHPRKDSTEGDSSRENRPSRPEKKPFVPAKPSVPNLNEPLRINKALAFAGICSRRAADDLIAQGVVFVNGEKVEEPGLKITPTSDVLEVNSERVVFDTEKVEPLYVLLHKPVQTVCTANDPEGRPTVLDILPEEFKGKRIFPVGRLDFFSTGLLLLTNDGDLTYRLTHPKWHQNKVYRVRVRGNVPEQVLEKFRKGMILEEGDKLAPVECKIIAQDEGNTRIEMVLTQGVNRQIRRMFRDVGLTILNLHRVKIGPVQIGDLEKGESRELTQEELAQIYEATGLSK